MFPTLLAVGLSHAATYDPELQWRTLTTEHFHIHFHQGVEQVADEFSVVVEDVYETMTEEIRWIPKGRTDLVLVDRTDDANGFATAVPYNAITIYVTAPTEDSTSTPTRTGRPRSSRTSSRTCSTSTRTTGS